MNDTNVEVVKRGVGRPRKDGSVSERIKRLKSEGYRVIGRVELNPDAAAALEVLMVHEKYLHVAIEKALMLAVKTRLA